MNTEEEAKKLWCPFAHNESKSLWMTATAPERCIASACMAWRRAQKPNPEWKQSHSMMWPPPDPRYEPPMFVKDETHGYCGLAGVP